MNTSKKVLASAIAASLAVSALAPVANAEVSGSAAISSSYLWRGYELGSGTPVVSGSLDYSSEVGFYAGIWGSSGDTTAGTEYDLYAGYGNSVGDFSYDIGIISYIYPTGPFSETEGIGDFMEAIISLGYGPVSFTYHDNIAGSDGTEPEGSRYALSEDYSYMKLAATFGQFGIAIGKHDKGAFDATHVDLSYSYNDNLTFTLSGIANSDADTDPKPVFNVSYSIPIE